jgi:hypothetical protein
MVSGKSSRKPDSSMVFKTACANIISIAPSTTYVKLSQIEQPWLSWLGRGLYSMQWII